MRNASIPALLTRVVNRPLLCTPEMARQYLGVLAHRVGVGGVLIDPTAGTEEDLMQLTAAGYYNGAEGKVFDTVPGTGIAVIEVMGGLVHRSGYVRPWSGLQGYDGLQAQRAAARDDAAVKGILWDHHCFGGEVSGCFDTADLIRADNAAKPVWGIADEASYSASFALLSQCAFIAAPRTAGVGSVGVIYMHVDWSRNFEQEGIKVTLIHAGAHKADGNPYQPLPKDVRDDIQAEAEALRILFAETVAAGCGIPVADVLATEARCLTAQEAKDNGFIDDIMPAHEAYAAFAEYLAGADTTVSVPAARAATPAKENTMAQRKGAQPGAASAKTTKQQTGAKASDSDTTADAKGDAANEDEEEEEQASSDDKGKDADDETEDEEDGADATADDEEEEASGGNASAAAKERKRIAGILQSPHAKGRKGLAEHFAYNTAMSVKEVEAALQAAPAERKGTLLSTMDNTPNADVGAGGTEASTDTNAMVASIVAAGALARGEKPADK